MKYNNQRDLFIHHLLQAARKDKDIMLLCPDMGAPALDEFREELPNQFLAMGIAEANTINVAAGLSASGKKVFIYAMACWMARCYEQIRYSICAANNPVTLIGTGVGLGYAPSGPAHCATEDIAYMRALVGMEIWSPGDLGSIPTLVEYCLQRPAIRYIRLERKIAGGTEWGNHIGFKGLEIGHRHCFGAPSYKSELQIYTCGYMLGRAIEAAKRIENSSVVDLFRIPGCAGFNVMPILANCGHIVTIEEQTLAGGFGSAIMESLARPVFRLGLSNRWIFENGTHDQLLDANGLAVDAIVGKIKNNLGL